MEKAQKTALRKCRVQLVTDLQIKDVYDFIDKYQLLTPIMLEQLKAKESRPDQVRAFLDLLPRRGPKAFNTFLQILLESGHKTLADAILLEYQQTGANLAELTINPRAEVLQNGETQEMETEPSWTGIQETQGGSGKCAPSTNSGPNYVPPSSSSGSFPESLSSRASSASLNGPGYTGNMEEEYRMVSDPRGLLLIINNKKFTGDLETRDGTDVDRDNLKELFLKLGFGVEIRENLKAMEIIANLNYLSKHSQLKDVDSLAVAILTHGSDDLVFGVDCVQINVYDIYNIFTADNCPALRNKPKFFIVNACRGDSEDKGSLGHSNISKCAASVDVRPMAEEGSVCRIPNMQDFLIAYSTIPRHVSWRHKHDGSFFIQGFVKVFSENANSVDVLRMLVKVNNSVSKIDEYAGIQIPAPQVMLTKTWYLNPPSTPRDPTGAS
ncbi:caspase-3-like [Mya arenaria]|uniref:caspase-3-like n=1 Tax=Mya arenaria TaxID=6604 RepID=UPI0022E70D30|nr:caspase-3-like [Mya arenaria]XP_052760722.1 caspase-3-like [Mya arenaria]XP_052760724.1 caspase-3-like [Mya arenaria]XP_052760725.1 caspase-3-like [Mya arenaria]XP_052760726.1 caspase-3-like [Mya arenaria]